MRDVDEELALENLVKHLIANQSSDSLVDINMAEVSEIVYKVCRFKDMVEELQDLSKLWGRYPDLVESLLAMEPSSRMSFDEVVAELAGFEFINLNERG